jgi:hypothetical protein
MMRARRMAGWSLSIADGLLVVGSGLFSVILHLDSADNWGSVSGGLVALLGLPLTVYSLAYLRQESAGDQRLTRVQVGGNVGLRNVGGSLGSDCHRRPLPSRPPSRRAAASPGGQSVAKSMVAGSVHLIAGVGGDVEIGG